MGLHGGGGRYGRGQGGQQETNMSLDNTSHLGRPGLDELVPSRYALRVGEIDVLVVSDGVLSLPCRRGAWQIPAASWSFPSCRDFRAS